MKKDGMMSRNWHKLMSAGTLVAVFTGSWGTCWAADNPRQVEFFESKIRPVLVQHCYKCHSAQAQSAGKLKGGLLLDNRAGLRRGGESGPAVVPGNLNKSLLLSAVRYEDLEMPPQGKLPAAVIANFAKWIKQGAADPRDGKRVVSTRIDLEQGRKFWSFQPLKQTTPPDVDDVDWSRTAVDRFVVRGLRKQGLQPVAEAAPAHLLRRLYFDLIGLPPDLQPVDPKASGPRMRERLLDIEVDLTRLTEPEALQAVVDALLDSPHFGERWGRHWLDVARYAESNGNSRNATFPHAWRYRDYVIDAFNADTPYDTFIKQQIAGDLLPHSGADQRNRNLVATGFLALGSKPVIRGKAGGFVPDVVADQIGVTSRAVLALSVSCARCHDHKFDPIPTTDYYGMAGIFASSRTLYGGGGKAMGGAPATGLHALEDKDPSKRRAYEQWQAKLNGLTKRQQAVAKQLKKLRPNRKKKKDTDTAEEVKQQTAELNKQRRELAKEIKSLRANPPETPGFAMGVGESEKVTEVAVHVRGVTAKGAALSRRLISVMAGQQTAFPTDGSGRMELANWLASSQNPLTARVMVNRVWQHLFGIGIVRTPDNFGVNGTRPTHPELLDHLALTFVQDGWSMKRLIRRLVLSRAYRSADAHNAANYEIDPDNVYLWRHARKRIEAEAIRDAILTASGQINLQRPQGSVVTAHRGKLIQDALTPDVIHQPSHHRSVYLPILRNGLPESLEVFDVADPSLVVGRRNVTIVPAQDLYLINSGFVIENSREFAKRILESVDDDEQRITAAYRWALSRAATEQEVSQARQFVREAIASLAATESAEENGLTAWAGFCQALFVSSEFRYTR
ncbi:MAG: PSD1 and planctomycete cytochrome C domain-containing protein [Planctomycetaceae bacterium]